MTSAKFFANALEAFLLLLVVSLAHRLLAFAPLSGGNLELLSADGLRALVVGLFSDFWVSYLGALLVLLMLGGASFMGVPNIGRSAAVVFVLALGCGAAMHQAYVEYFHFQIIPFHLSYMVDREFVAANIGSLLNPRSGLILIVFAGAAFALLRADLFGAWTVKRQACAFALLSLISLGLHNRNIRYRVQWFVPENLQANTLERLYLHVRATRLPAALNPTQLTGLASMLGADPSPFTSPVSPSQFFRFLTLPVTGDAPRPIANFIREAFAQALVAKEKPVVMIVLMESLRPSETGYFAPNAGPSLTPTLDALSAHGITFMHAYSTGSVTRGAQEATFCGYLGSRDTSLMRGEGIARLTCLPDLAGAGRKGARGETFWYHGGDQRFDGQVAYWRLHHVHQFLTLSDFPPDAPRTGWGVGDRRFFTTAAARLSELHQRTDADYLLGMGLSVTNHVDWELPADAGAEVNAPRTSGHDSYKTTAYSDAALGGFVDALRADHLWKDTLLIVASDHGNNVEPLVDLYSGVQDRSRLLQSHINLIVTGGLVDQALATIGVANMSIDDVVSQADIASFAGYVIDLPEARFMGQNLLKQGRALPVLSDLEEDLFDHSTGHIFSRSEIVKGDPNVLPPAERKALLYYRAFLQFIYTAP